MTQVCENGYLGKSGDRFGKVHTQNMVDILFFYYNFFLYNFSAIRANKLVIRNMRYNC